MQIHGEYFLPVEHNLLGKPDVSIEEIKYVRSHAQAISQCQKIINEKKEFSKIIDLAEEFTDNLSLQWIYSKNIYFIGQK